MEEVESSVGAENGSSSEDTGCSASFLGSDFTVVTDLALGLLQSLDIEADGAPDLIGGRGVVLRSNLEVVTVEGVPATNNGLGGHFDGDDVLDLVYATSTRGDIVVFPAILDAPGAPIITPATDGGSFDARDYDEDGIDDVALITTSGDVEAWRGRGDGTFELDDIVSSQLGLVLDVAFVKRSGRAMQLAVSGSDGIALFEYDDATGDFGEPMSFAAAPNFSIEPVDVEGDGDEEILAQAWFDNGLEVVSVVSIFFYRDAEWQATSHRLDGDSPLDVAHHDVDGDGVRELFVAYDHEVDGPIIEAVCFAADELSPCGSTAIAHVPESIGILGDPLSLAYSTTTEGAWAGPLTSACE